MYLIPLIVLILIGIVAVAWTPIFAVIIAVPAFIAFLLYVGMRPRADEKVKPPAGRPRTVESDVRKGAWGEPRP
jgi:hypothetical protein